ncbi:hypothetical protein KP509_37G021900 [Ceratopteris richardii]|nr:hypothetical protein KP509_37G021900 [Ceratopteris richardii]
MFKEETGMVKNATFIEDVSKHLKKDEKFIVACQSGRRSLMASNSLIAEGFTGVKDMGGGFTAWVECGQKAVLD